MVGILLLIVGLVMSIREKVWRDSKRIIMALILATYLIYGCLSLTRISGIVNCNKQSEANKSSLELCKKKRLVHR
ncbi:MAG: hypothetical protein CMB43_03420 [Euryarchaeota archaeon]|nr:hypothetical protein [Euryarchaeota archaeon]